MKYGAEFATYDAGDSALEVVGLTDLEVTVIEKTTVSVSHTAVMSRGRGQDVVDSYQISKDFLNQQARRRMENNKN